MGDIHIRKCDLGDLHQLKEISIRTFLDTYAHLNSDENVKKHIDQAFNDQQLSSELSHPDISFYFFYFRDELCGYLKLCRNDTQSEEMSEEYLEIERIYILNKFQRKGLGRKMVDHTISVALNLGKSKVWLGVWKKNPEAVAFYKKVGFSVFGEHTFTVGADVQSDWMMEMNLKP
ncbi:MAG: GNAT family N-acetyltransferase [Saprospiraceae bacterium]|nr:GNAT family N-acetyltransferase [Saprospiraceae bacterium]